MKITNPNWHPEAPSQLTVAQRRNAKRLLGSDIHPIGGSERISMASLVRHGLAKLKWPDTETEACELHTATDKLKDWRARGLI